MSAEFSSFVAKKKDVVHTSMIRGRIWMIRGVFTITVPNTYHSDLTIPKSTEVVHNTHIDIYAYIYIYIYMHILGLAFLHEQ